MELVDVVYGTVTLPPEIVEIIRTPLFQRLHHIKQLGVMGVVFPQTQATRFQHCIGTYSRAKNMLDCLEYNTPKQPKIPSLYRQAVEIAALLHDIGHGPFSHAWEHVCVGSFNHEQNGFACIDEIFNQVNYKLFQVLFAQNRYGVELVKSLIIGDANYLPQPLPIQYNFIFDIVSNKRNGLDVDKWDYLKRDSYYLRDLCQPPMDWETIFLEARVASDGSCIEYRYEDYQNIYKLYKARWEMHRKCYRYPKVLACEKLLQIIVNRSNATINGLRLVEITAERDIQTFLELTNAKVLALIKDDEYFQYLMNPQRIIQMNDSQEIRLCNVDSDMLIVVHDQLPCPGLMMPSDDKFQFYGDETKKALFSRDTETKRFEWAFALV